jgi:hypothetical protein
VSGQLHDPAALLPDAVVVCTLQETQIFETNYKWTQTERN